MPQFTYEVINSLGKKRTGKIESTDQDSAIKQLTAAGNTVVTIKKSGLLDMDIGGSKKKVKLRDMTVFCRQFVSIIRAGVPLVQALKMLEAQTQSKTLKDTVQGLRVSVEKGSTLTQAMTKYDYVFPPLFINIVRAGEETGNIDRSFEQMAIHFEKQARLRAMVKKAMMYPLIVSILAIVVVVVMLVWIVPSFMDMFNGMDMEMPAYTMFIVSLSDFLIDKWYFVIGIVLLLVVAFRLFRSTDTGRHVLANMLLTMPILGKLNVKTGCAQFARNLKTMLGAGINIANALGIVSDTMDNLLYKECVAEVKTNVEMGIPLARSLEKTGMFPPMVYNMVGIGEESGSTEEMLGNVANYYEEEVEEATAQPAATMEPLLIIALAGLCLAIIAAVFLPIITMYEGMENLG